MYTWTEYFQTDHFYKEMEAIKLDIQTDVKERDGIFFFFFRVTLRCSIH